MTTPPKLIWYVSYASNLRRERFMAYITGGLAPGASVPQVGCADPTPPRDDRAITIPYQLYFAAKSAVWGGAPAFIDHRQSKTVTRARAYLITQDQFNDIVAQETSMVSLRHAPTAPASYNRLVKLGYLDGHPMITCTSPVVRTDIAVPPPVYLQTMAIGLAQSHHLTPHQIATYLQDKPGIAGHYTHAQLLEAIAPVTVPV